MVHWALKIIIKSIALPVIFLIIIVNVSANSQSLSADSGSSKTLRTRDTPNTSTLFVTSSTFLSDGQRLLPQIDQTTITEIQSLDDTIIQKRIALTIAIHTKENNKALNIEHGITALLEKKQYLESKISFQIPMDSINFSEFKDSIISNVSEYKLETSRLKGTANETKSTADSLLKIMQKKNRSRLTMISENASPKQIAAITDEILILKGQYIKTQQELNLLRDEIQKIRIENMITQEKFKVEKVEFVASANRNDRNLYEVSMKEAENDTTHSSSIIIRFNVLERVNGEVAIVEELIENTPSGMNGLRAFDITPSIDLLINMENAVIELPFKIKEIEGTDLQKLAIYHFNGNQSWEVVEGCSIDVERKVIAAKVTHFSIYGIFTEDAVSMKHTINSKPNQLSIASRNINSAVSFDFSVPEKSFIQIFIYTLNGKLVAKPATGIYNKGFYSITWNGKNNFRKNAALGKYIAELTTKDRRITKPFTMVR